MRYLSVATLLTLGLYYVFPDLDLAVSKLFYQDSVGFVYANHPVIVVIEKCPPFITGTVIWGLVLMATANALKDLRLLHCFRGLLSQKQIAFLVLALSVGPGILVHVIMKKGWGRVRPAHIVEFGGEKQYSPPIAYSNQGGESFPSGHAAVGFFLSAFAYVAGRRKQLLYGSGLVVGAILGLVRIMEGAHFLSDVFFAAIAILWTIHILYLLMFRGSNDRFRS